MRERARSWLGRIASLLVFVAFALGSTLIGDKSGDVFLAVLLPFVGGALLVDLGKRLGEGEIEKTDVLWGLAGASLLVAGIFFVAKVGWVWLAASAVLLAVEVVVLRFLPEPPEEPDDTDGSAVREEDHVIPEHVADERARRGVPPM